MTDTTPAGKDHPDENSTRPHELDERFEICRDVQADLETGSVQVHLEGERNELTSSMASRIGPYRILNPLGEGGMGIVYLAERTAPIRQRVALKVIKLGMDTREVIARFEVERQALAAEVERTTDDGQDGQSGSLDGLGGAVGSSHG